ncbi:hypothetical protein ZWY2020_020981, partial [Hordeum vulgare]
PLPTPPPWLGFQAELHRCVFGGPRWSMLWGFPINHGRCRQGLVHRDVKDDMDMHILKVYLVPISSHPLPLPSSSRLLPFSHRSAWRNPSQ